MLLPSDARPVMPRISDGHSLMVFSCLKMPPMPWMAGYSEAMRTRKTVPWLCPCQRQYRTEPKSRKPLANLGSRERQEAEFSSSLRLRSISCPWPLLSIFGAHQRACDLPRDRYIFHTCPPTCHLLPLPNHRQPMTILQLHVNFNLATQH